MVQPVWTAMLCLTFTLLTLLFVIQSKMMHVCHYSNATINTDIKITISDLCNVGGGPYFWQKSSVINWQPATGPISTVQRS